MESKTVHLIYKQAEIHFKNEQSGVSEFHVQCLKKQNKRKEKVRSILL